MAQVCDADGLPFAGILSDDKEGNLVDGAGGD